MHTTPHTDTYTDMYAYADTQVLIHIYAHTAVDTLSRLNGPSEEVSESSEPVKEGNNGTNLFLSVKTL